ncbi:MAG: hypothetical protein HY332_03895 [Chloroflexi bacterium]|nr:hypothetical protein [Chloroflexota bacterium]
MPELPEVEGLRRRLVPRLVGARIERLEVRDAKLWHPAEGLSEAAVAGRTVLAIDRYAKLLVFSLSGDLAFALHLKIAGQGVYQSVTGERLIGGHPYPLPGAVLPDPSTRFILWLGSGAAFFVNDQRRFSWLRLMPAAQVSEFVASHRYGPDPLAPDFTPDVLVSRLRARKGRPIKAALLDQTCLAGLGNIYADESLHAARLHPMLRAGDLTPADVRRLHAAIKHVLDIAVPVGGAIVKNGRAVADVESGRDFLRVHGRAGQPCPDCVGRAGGGSRDGSSDGSSRGATAQRSGAAGEAPRIVRAFLAGRGTYFCPVCQPAPPECGLG